MHPYRIGLGVKAIQAFLKVVSIESSSAAAEARPRHFLMTPKPWDLKWYIGLWKPITIYNRTIGLRKFLGYIQLIWSLNYLAPPSRLRRSGHTTNHATSGRHVVCGLAEPQHHAPLGPRAQASGSGKEDVSP